MGIPSYFSYIIKNHKNIIKKQSELKQVDYFYLDSNSIIYDSLRDVIYTTDEEYENKIINTVIERINNYIKNINPSYFTMVAFDGVAPVAKMQQQRTRRYKSGFIDDIINNVSGNIKEDKKWDKAAITPGTKFMGNLGSALNKFYRKNKNVIISNTDEEGEGEHKIFNLIRNKNDKMGNILIYGLDADLIMLSLTNLSYSNNVYIYRETPEFIKSIDYSFEPNILYCLDIKLLSKSIIYEMTSMNNKFYSKNILYDYIFICFLLGNDFLPHFPSLNIRTHGINILLSAYYNTLGVSRKTIIDNEEIQWGNFKKLIDWIKSNEKNNLIIEYELRDKFENRKYRSKTREELIDKLNNIPTQKREIEKLIEPDSFGWKTRYYKYLFDTDITDDILRDISVNYLEGLEWVFKYYTKGCYDWKWKYKYNYPPLFCDLLEYIPNWETNMLKKNTNGAVTPEVQLAYVLPPKSLHLLAQEKRDKLLKTIPDFYKGEFDIKWSFCKYFWEAHVDFTEIDINELELILN